ncbi:mucin-17-like isoform X1 [Biomphalaria glabrata]|uniref:Mucin-17-like isoform X1 n=2 Tax=Biomphalaria glabrata TaxID=6526 RepID=A0A9U8E5W7_BIOGL|nr:mucin-17-like isoform X1 [Biomphalaria glabrata]XP_013073243.2 mucin-17-like isoform X1 [Biomphalaria glabrata]XP_013073258.2 mucin-17-like isoform X1 [Biomphalaria glabrata]
MENKLHIVFMVCVHAAHALYPYGFSFGDTTLTGASSESIQLPFPLPFYGSNQDSYKVFKDGFITFDLTEDVDSHFFDESDVIMIPVIGPWVSRIVASTDHLGDVTYRMTSNETILSDVSSLVGKSQEFSDSFLPVYALIVTWDNVGTDSFNEYSFNKKNTFQLVVATDGDKTLVTFEYSKIEWVFYDAISMYDYPTYDIKTKVGFYRGNGDSMLLPVSMSHDLFTIDTDSNINKPGLYVFRVDISPTNLTFLESNPITDTPSTVISSDSAGFKLETTSYSAIYSETASSSPSSIFIVSMQTSLLDSSGLIETSLLDSSGLIQTSLLDSSGLIATSTSTTIISVVTEASNYLTSFTSITDVTLGVLGQTNDSSLMLSSSFSSNENDAAKHSTISFTGATYATSDLASVGNSISSTANEASPFSTLGLVNTDVSGSSVLVYSPVTWTESSSLEITPPDSDSKQGGNNEKNVIIGTATTGSVVFVVAAAFVVMLLWKRSGSNRVNSEQSIVKNNLLNQSTLDRIFPSNKVYPPVNHMLVLDDPRTISVASTVSTTSTKKLMR